MADGETWKDIDGCPGYQVSNLGRVRSFWKRTGTPPWALWDTPQRILRAWGETRKSGGCYLFVNLGTGKTAVRIHKLVADAFLGPCPNGMEICHNDGDSTNNRANNLRYDTRRGNMMDVPPSKRGCAKIDRSNVIIIRKRILKGETAQEVSVDYPVSASTISKIARGITYSDIEGPVAPAHRGKAKITQEIAEIIRQRYKRGKITMRALGDRYGITESAISRIISGYTWSPTTPQEQE